MGELKTFETLECYKLGRELRRAVSKFCKTLPREEEYRLKDQIVRSSRSVQIYPRGMEGITIRKTCNFAEPPVVR